MDIKKLIGNRINTALAKRGMKQKDLAKALGVVDNTISYYCKGSRTPSLQQLPLIADILEVSTDFLLGKTDVMSPSMEKQAISSTTQLSEENIEYLSQNQWFARYFFNEIIAAFRQSESISTDWILFADAMATCDTAKENYYEHNKTLDRYEDEFERLKNKGFLLMLPDDAARFFLSSCMEKLRESLITQYGLYDSDIGKRYEESLSKEG